MNLKLLGLKPLFLDRLIVAQETGDDEEVAFQIKTHPALKEFPPHYRNGFKLLVSKCFSIP